MTVFVFRVVVQKFYALSVRHEGSSPCTSVNCCFLTAIMSSLHGNLHLYYILIFFFLDELYYIYSSPPL